MVKMSLISRSLLAWAVLCMVLLLFQRAAAVKGVVVSAKCDPRGMIPQGSSYWGHLGNLLQVLGDNTPYTPSYHFKTLVGGGDNPAFGEAYCRSPVSAAQCQACLRRLSSDIWRICNSALGARVEYPYCWIHYEDSYF